MSSVNGNGPPPPASGATELATVLERFGVRGVEVQAVGSVSRTPQRTLILDDAGCYYQLRSYPTSAPGPMARLIEANLHLRRSEPDRLLALRPGPQGPFVSRGEHHHLLLELPPGAQPLPPQWGVATLAQLGACLAEVERGSAGFRPWRDLGRSGAWTEEMDERVTRVERLGDERYSRGLPKAVAHRLVEIVPDYLRLARANAEAARALVDVHESVIWDAAGRAGFAVGPVAPDDIFVTSDQRLRLAWVDRTIGGMTWDGMLGEMARGGLSENLDDSVQGLAGAHRAVPFSDELLQLLPVFASPLQSFLELLETAVADAPVAHPEALLRVLDGPLGNPARGEAWARHLVERLTSALG